MVVEDMDNAHAVALAPALIVEDDPAVQQRLQRLLVELVPGAAPATLAGSLADARRQLDSRRISFALVDIGLPDGNGLELIEHLHSAHPQVSAMVVSAWGQEDTVLTALRLGAVGYLLKERDDVEISLSLRSVQRGGAPIDPSIAARILRLLAEPSPPRIAPAPEPIEATESPLSEREQQILSLVSRGYSNREIAELTALSRFTIEDYTKSIYRKLAVSSRTAAVFEAKAKGLLS